MLRPLQRVQLVIILPAVEFLDNAPHVFELDRNSSSQDHRSLSLSSLINISTARMITGPGTHDRSPPLRLLSSVSASSPVMCSSFSLPGRAPPFPVLSSSYIMSFPVNTWASCSTSQAQRTSAEDDMDYERYDDTDPWF